MAINLIEGSPPGDLELLQNFLINNPELDLLEELTDQFNIFEVLGAVRVELRHSDFLAYLLNPNQNHGLGSNFLRRLLEGILLESGTTQEIRPIDLELWDLDDIEVRREWQNIDIFLLDDTHKFVVIIENKIKSGESPNQLNEYLQTVRHQFWGYKVLPIFLTPDGATPSLDSYLAVSYQTVCEMLEHTINRRKSTLGSEVFTVIQHYTQMLRRYIMDESEISELCRSIYRKHQRALDLIYEYRPDLQGIIRDYLVDLINHNPDFKIIRNIKSEIRFIPVQWEIQGLKSGIESPDSDRLLFWYFQIRPNGLSIRLLIGPGQKDLRQKLLDMALINHPPFKSSYKNLNQMWNNIYATTILGAKDYEELEVDAIKEKIRNAMQKFLESDFIAVLKLVKEQDWIWGNSTSLQ